MMRFLSHILMTNGVRAVAVAVALVAALSSCTGFYSQATRGQAEILIKRRPISQVLRDPQVDADTRTKLALVQDIRRFARQRLKLNFGDQYASYADLKRESVVWNVMAAPAFSLQAKTWCYPVAGCVGYRGFFDELDAKRLVADLETEGYDVYSGGVDAYSTLGYLDDPVLNTFLQRGDVELAALLFHELAHAHFYLKGDTAFNESFATTVEYEGLRLWLQERGETKVYAKYLDYEAAMKVFRKLVGDTREQLHRLYTSGQSRTVMQERKALLIAQLRDRYLAIKPQLKGASFDGWFLSDINNAKLNSVATYENQVPPFQALLQLCAQDFTCFYQRVERLASLPKPQRDAALQRLAQEEARTKSKGLQ